MTDTSSSHGQERPLTCDQRLISTTDTEGKITYCNQSFIDISGYSREELIGSSHNIVRHPDMPASVFALMWRYLRRGKNWTGIVKNRCKNGDYYWVNAYVTPIRENGKVVGYESVRIKPTAAQVERATMLYLRINQGKRAVAWCRWIKHWAGQLAVPFIALGVAGLAAMLVSSSWGLAVSMAGLLITGVVGINQQEARLRKTLSRVPEAFADPVVALTFSDHIGAQAETEMALISTEAQLRTALTRLTDYAEQLDRAATETGVLAQKTQSELEAQRSEAELTAAAMVEMAASVDEVATNVQHTVEQAQSAYSLSQQGDDISSKASEVISVLLGTVTEISEAVNHLAKETQSIASAATIIQAIADQTNLLALNAAIEAARAGDQGRGFAVVADEVRSLATKTRQSTLHIQAIIDALRSSAEQAVAIAELGKQEAKKGAEQMQLTQQVLARIRGALDNITSLGHEMAAVSAEQARVAEDVARQITNVAQSTERNVEYACITVVRGQEVSRSASDLRVLAERFYKQGRN